MKISYAVTTHNEGHSIQKLLERLNSFKRVDDEIIILDDNSTDIDTINILKKNNNVFSHKFNNNFSDHKNYLNSLCSKDYIFQFDGDELPTISLLKFMEITLSNVSKVDLFWVPRENKLYDLDKNYIKKLNWKLDKQNRINYPDYQGRCFKRCDHIKWTRPVHEIITGHKSQVVLPQNSNLDIIHHRHMTHQIRSNKFYDETFK